MSSNLLQANFLSVIHLYVSSSHFHPAVLIMVSFMSELIEDLLLGVRVLAKYTCG